MVSQAAVKRVKAAVPSELIERGFRSEFANSTGYSAIFKISDAACVRVWGKKNRRSGLVLAVGVDIDCNYEHDTSSELRCSSDLTTLLPFIDALVTLLKS